MHSIMLFAKMVAYLHKSRRLFHDGEWGLSDLYFFNAYGLAEYGWEA